MYWLIKNDSGDTLYCMQEPLPNVSKVFEQYNNNGARALFIPTHFAYTVGYDVLYLYSNEHDAQYLLQWRLLYSIIEITRAEYETYNEMRLFKEVKFILFLEKVVSVVDKEWSNCVKERRKRLCSG